MNLNEHELVLASYSIKRIEISTYNLNQTLAALKITTQFPPHPASEAILLDIPRLLCRDLIVIIGDQGLRRSVPCETRASLFVNDDFASVLWKSLVVPDAILPTAATNAYLDQYTYLY